MTEDINARDVDGTETEVVRYRGEEEKKKETSMKIIFHREWLKYIKDSLGKKCTYISHMREKKGGVTKYFMKVNLLNKDGGRDKIIYELSTTPDNLKGEDYKQLLKILMTKAYEGVEEVL